MGEENSKLEKETTLGEFIAQQENNPTVPKKWLTVAKPDSVTTTNNKEEKWPSEGSYHDWMGATRNRQTALMWLAYSLQFADKKIEKNNILALGNQAIEDASSPPDIQKKFDALNSALDGVDPKQKEAADYIKTQTNIIVATVLYMPEDAENRETHINSAVKEYMRSVRSELNAFPQDYVRSAICVLAAAVVGALIAAAIVGFDISSGFSFGDDDLSVIAGASLGTMAGLFFDGYYIKSPQQQAAVELETALTNCKPASRT